MLAHPASLVQLQLPPVAVEPLVLAQPGPQVQLPPVAVEPPVVAQPAPREQEHVQEQPVAEKVLEIEQPASFLRAGETYTEMEHDGDRGRVHDDIELQGDNAPTIDSSPLPAAGPQPDPAIFIDKTHGTLNFSTESTIQQPTADPQKWVKVLEMLDRGTNQRKRGGPSFTVRLADGSTLTGQSDPRFEHDATLSEVTKVERQALIDAFQSSSRTRKRKF